MPTQAAACTVRTSLAREVDEPFPRGTPLSRGRGAQSTVATACALGYVARNEGRDTEFRIGLTRLDLNTGALLGEVLLLAGGLLVPAFTAGVACERAFGPVHVDDGGGTMSDR